jgi:hypothetical protein
MTVHTEFRKGQRVRIILRRKGEPHVIGKFEENKRGAVVVGGTRYPLTEIRSITIDRNDIR